LQVTVAASNGNPTLDLISLGIIIPTIITIDLRRKAIEVTIQ
jgi:hypothetical protein